MKKTISSIVYSAILIALAGNVAWAQIQPQPQTPTHAQTKEPKKLSDQSMSDRLQKDLNERNAMTANQSIEWWDGNGYYYGTYSLSNQNYITRYDTEGNYNETLIEKEWDATVPAAVVTSFNQSPYKDYQVTKYYEVSDPGKKGYYFELDKDGIPTRVWLNDKGKFSTMPYKVANTSPKTDY
jgi:hypothetical protein